MKTAHNIIVLLNGAISFRSLVDPDGLLAAGTIRRISRERDSEDYLLYRWDAQVSYSEGRMLMLSGTWKVGNVLLTGLTLVSDGRKVIVSLSEDSTLTKALGDLSRIPAELKKLLDMRNVKSGMRDGEPWGDRLFRTEESALLWHVERDGIDDSVLSGFRKVNVVYEYSANGAVVSAQFMMSCPFGAYSVIVETRADYCGLGAKSVRLSGPFSEEGRIITECVRARESGFMPSLSVAFALLRKLTSSKPKQRKKKMKI